MKNTHRLGTLEKEIMDIMWKQASCHIRDVHAELSRKRTIAYTTVMTVMVRLVGKGLLRRKKDGNTFLYTCQCSKEHFVRSNFHHAITHFFSSLGGEAVAAFAEELKTLPEKKRKELVSLLKKK